MLFYQKLRVQFLPLKIKETYETEVRTQLLKEISEYEELKERKSNLKIA